MPSHFDSVCDKSLLQWVQTEPNRRKSELAHHPRNGLTWLFLSTTKSGKYSDDLPAAKRQDQKVRRTSGPKNLVEEQKMCMVQLSSTIHNLYLSHLPNHTPGGLISWHGT